MPISYSLNSSFAAFPWDQIPILEIDGQVLAQSLAIARYLARKYDFIGESEFEAAKCDEYVDAVSENRDSESEFADSKSDNS